MSYLTPMQLGCIPSMTVVTLKYICVVINYLNCFIITHSVGTKVKYKYDYFF